MRTYPISTQRWTLAHYHDLFFNWRACIVFFIKLPPQYTTLNPEAYYSFDESIDGVYHCLPAECDFCLHTSRVYTPSLLNPHNSTQMCATVVPSSTVM